MEKSCERWISYWVGVMLHGGIKNTDDELSALAELTDLSMERYWQISDAYKMKGWPIR